MTPNEYEVGQIYVKSVGYSMVLYDFFRIVRVSDKSIFIEQLEEHIHPMTTDGFRPYVVPDVNSHGKVIRKSKTSYIGYLWDGKPCQEDHLD